MLVDVSTYRSPWRTREELDRAAKARRFYASQKVVEKPARNSNYDGEISKRRDKS